MVFVSSVLFRSSLLCCVLCPVVTGDEVAVLRQVGGQKVGKALQEQQQQQQYQQQSKPMFGHCENGCSKVSHTRFESEVAARRFQGVHVSQ